MSAVIAGTRGVLPPRTRFSMWSSRCWPLVRLPCDALYMAEGLANGRFFSLRRSLSRSSNSSSSSPRSRARLARVSLWRGSPIDVVRGKCYYAMHEIKVVGRAWRVYTDVHGRDEQHFKCHHYYSSCTPTPYVLRRRKITVVGLDDTRRTVYLHLSPVRQYPIL